MDEVNLTRAQVKRFAKLDVDVTVSAVNGDEGMIYWERTRHRGDRGEGKWMMANGRDREEKA